MNIFLQYQEEKEYCNFLIDNCIELDRKTKQFVKYPQRFLTNLVFFFLI